MAACGVFGATILILIPHPDDEVVGAFAALGRARAAGARVLGAQLTDGVPRHLWPWQRRDVRVATRRTEARSVAAGMGLELVSAQDVPSRELRLHLRDTLRRLGQLIDEQRVDTLWAPAYEGGHQDHDVSCWLAAQLRERVAVWEFSEYHFAGARVHSQDFISPRGDERLLTLDAREQRAKRAALAAYASERGNLGHVGVEREVFRPLRDYDWSRPPHAGRTFYQRFQWVRGHPRVDHTRPEAVCARLSRPDLTEPGRPAPES